MIYIYIYIVLTKLLLESIIVLVLLRANLIGRIFLYNIPALCYILLVITI